MTYLNVGVKDSRGANLPTKKKLKELLASDPANVTFYHTAELFNGPGEFDGTAVPNDVKLSVVGPDPATSRRWYATVEKGTKGALKVS